MSELPMMSENIAELSKALAIAQGKITGALKDSANPFYKSKYADLAACWDACRGPLSENGLAVIQTTDVDDQGITLFTTLGHSSGQWIRGRLRMIPKDSTPQAAGSTLTYARRYALAAIVGIAQVDDDANEASGKTHYADPRGEEWKKADSKKVESYVNRIMTALTADKDEMAIADDLYEIHLELIKDNDLYIAVGNQLSAKDRKSLKVFIDMAKAAAKVGAHA